MNWRTLTQTFKPVTGILLVITLNGPVLWAADGSVIRNISVRRDPSSKNSARIRWTLGKSNTSPIYIGKLNRPIIDSQTLREAINITPGGLKPETHVYVDRNLPEGSYYYVVVTLNEIKKSDKLRLVPEQNFTVSPFTVMREEPEKTRKAAKLPREKPVSATRDKEASKPSTDRGTPKKKDTTDIDIKDVEKKTVHGPRHAPIVNVKTSSSEDGVRISWRPRPKAKTVFHVYRSDRPFRSPEDFAYADLIAVVPENSKNFVDPDPPKDRSVFYAVTAVETDPEDEYKSIVSQRSYAIHIPGEKEKERPPAEQIAAPSFLMAYPAGPGSVRIVWGPAGADNVVKWVIRRSAKPIRNLPELQAATVLSSTPMSARGFTDASAPADGAYYAVTAVKGDGSEFLIFEPGKTVIDHIVLPGGYYKTSEKESETAPPEDIDYEEDSAAPESGSSEKPRETPTITGIRVIRTLDGIRISWKLDGKSAITHTFLIYRGTSPLKDIQTIEKQGELLAEVSEQTWSYVDRQSGKGPFYYAVLLENQGILTGILQPDDSYTIDPISFPARMGESMDK